MEWSRRHIWAVILLSCLVFGSFWRPASTPSLERLHRIEYPDFKTPQRQATSCRLPIKSVIKQSALCKKQPKIVIKNTVLKSDQY